jgi:hypothetical protein
MYHKSTKCDKISAGIISFRNLSNGLMGLKITNSQLNIIEPATLKEFEDELKSLINEIMDPKVDFIDSQS